MISHILPFLQVTVTVETEAGREYTKNTILVEFGSNAPAIAIGVVVPIVVVLVLGGIFYKCRKERTYFPPRRNALSTSQGEATSGNAPAYYLSSSSSSSTSSSSSSSSSEIPPRNNKRLSVSKI